MSEVNGPCGICGDPTMGGSDDPDWCNACDNGALYDNPNAQEGLNERAWRDASVHCDKCPNPARYAAIIHQGGYKILCENHLAIFEAAYVAVPSLSYKIVTAQEIDLEKINEMMKNLPAPAEKARKVTDDPYAVKEDEPRQTVQLGGKCKGPGCNNDIRSGEGFLVGNDRVCGTYCMENLMNARTGSFIKGAPYGIPKDKGGDSEANVSKMERCVEKVMAKGHDKSSAIAICKTSLGFTKEEHTASNEEKCPACGSDEKKPQWMYDGKSNYVCLDDWHKDWKDHEVTSGLNTTDRCVNCFEREKDHCSACGVCPDQEHPEYCTRNQCEDCGKEVGEKKLKDGLCKDCR